MPLTRTTGPQPRAGGRPPAGRATGPQPPGAAGTLCGGPRPAVLFPAWRGWPLPLSRALYGTFPVFRAAFDTVCGALDEVLGLPLAAVVFAPQDGVDARLLRRPEFGQAALFAYEVALYRLLQDWGVHATAVAGDGVGALAAAHVTGTTSLRPAARRAGAPLAATAQSAEHRLRTAGHAHVLTCGPCAPTAATPPAVGDSAALLKALSHLCER
ncbi:acyltransferase domain-containing protein [Streptomyces sp. 4N124]|uniref:acyltransferase domain-containing protein n=1 Tax=Streptomyces sp. 4N124 TaxID=3457420 RepID=UPI003FD63A98